jgi:hypothetical protein
MVSDASPRPTTRSSWSQKERSSTANERITGGGALETEWYSRIGTSGTVGPVYARSVPG